MDKLTLIFSTLLIVPYQKQRSRPHTIFMTMSLKTTPSLTMYHMNTGIPTKAYMMVKNLPQNVRGTMSP